MNYFFTFQAEGDLEETTERQFEEVEEQMQAWSRVRREQC